MGSVIMLTAYAITSGVREVKKRRKQRKAKREGLLAAEGDDVVEDTDTAVGFGMQHAATHSPQPDQLKTQSQSEQTHPETTPKHKTQAQLDQELMEKLASQNGDAAGVEYEDGKPVSMKRGVRENMFRYI